MACRKLDSLVIIFTIILMVAGIPGCSDDSSDGIENNGVNVSGSTFDWDAGHPIPVNREGSVIDFYSTTEKEEVINQSLETGKLIFCYLSKYDDFQTNEVESVFIANSRWGAEINRRYIPWEVDFWIDPTLALYLSSGGGHAVDRSPAWLPAIILLKPDEEDSDKFLVVECWKLSDIPYFPFKCTLGTYSYEQGMENSPKETEVGDALDAFETAEGLQFAYYRNPPNNILNPLSEMRWMLDLEVEYVDGDGRTGPDLLTYLALQELIDGKEFQNLPKEINQWAEWNFSMIDTNFISLNTCPTLDPSLSTGTIMGVDIPDNLIGMALAHSQDIDYPVNPGDMFDELYSMVVDEDGNFTGGFPAYIDSNFTLGAYDHVMPDVNPFELLFNENAMEDLLADPPPVFGPRDIVWVNARILTLWLQMVKFDAELKKLEMPNGQDAGEFLYELSAVMLASMEDLVNIDTPVDMNLADRTFMLGLYLELYQLTGDFDCFGKAGQIAATFPSDNSTNWFNPSYKPFYPDLAIGLHRYSWLAGDVDSGETARLITERAPDFIQMATGDSNEAWLQYAYDIVHSDCLNVSIIGPQDDENTLALLEAATDKWDPRKIVQILDPARDAELIETRGIEAGDSVVAFICVDGEISLPVNDPGELREQIENTTLEFET